MTADEYISIILISVAVSVPCALIGDALGNWLVTKLLSPPKRKHPGIKCCVIEPHHWKASSPPK